MKNLFFRWNFLAKPSIHVLVVVFELSVIAFLLVLGRPPPLVTRARLLVLGPSPRILQEKRDC